MVALMKRLPTRLLLFAFACLTLAACGGGEERPFDGARQGVAVHGAQIERYCRRADSADGCRAEIRNLEVHQTVNMVPFEELCRLLGNPNNCEPEGRQLDAAFQAGRTTSFYTCSRTTCYCDTGLPYDCYVMKLNHCGGVEPTEIEGAGGIKSCGCQNNCAE